jgi:alpha-beta hydrolase superfamily lysophospholipase
MSQRPSLADRPRVIMGLSAGAMVLPTVVARQPAAFDAAILIAGGADYMSIALRSSYAGWVDALRFVWLGAAPTEQQRREAIALYRSASPLDPLRTAPVLRTMPTLMIHARSDTAVPADLGDELWELAGRPERWSFAGGHEWLFIFLPGHTERMISWLRGAASERRPLAPPVGSAASEPRAAARIGGAR